MSKVPKKTEECKTVQFSTYKRKTGDQSGSAFYYKLLDDLESTIDLTEEGFRLGVPIDMIASNILYLRASLQMLRAHAFIILP